MMNNITINPAGWQCVNLIWKFKYSQFPTQTYYSFQFVKDWFLWFTNEPEYEKRLNDCYDECHKTDIMKELLGWSDSIKRVVLRAGR